MFFSAIFTRTTTFVTSCLLLDLPKFGHFLTLQHSERPKLYAILAFLSVIGLKDLELIKGLRVDSHD